MLQSGKIRKFAAYLTNMPGLFTKHSLILIIIIACGCMPWGATALHAAPSSQQNLSGSRSKSGTYKKPSTSIKDTTTRKPGSAWTLTTPLGEHKKSTIDTTLYNYQRQWVPSMRTDAYATTGALGAPGIDMLFLNRKSTSTFFFDNALDEWLPSMGSMKFYNVYIPMTLLSYNFGGSKINHQDRLNLQFAGNVNRKIGIGAHIDYLYSKGSYEDQAVKNFNFSLSGYYTGNRYEMQIFYYHFNSVNKENGGITDDLYITDPAEVQGGVDKVEPKSIPVNLNDAHSRLRGDRLFTTHALKLGYWREEQVNDTLTREVYVPVTRFVYSLDYEGRHHQFINTNASEDATFWTNRYFNPEGTDDHTRYWTVTNTLGVELLEGFRKWAKFGLNAYVSLQNRQITQNSFYAAPELTEEQMAQLTPLPENGENLPPPRVTQTRMWVGGQLSKRQGAAIRYSADVKFGVLGGVIGEAILSGTVDSKFKLFGDTVSIGAYGGFGNKSHSYLLSHYTSNHFIWEQKLNKMREVKAGGKLVIPWTKTTISAGFRNLQNYVYFNKEGIPTQHTGNVQIFSASLDQKLRFGIWNWNNTITYQATSDKNIIPLPALTVYSNMFLNFKAFKVLEVQFGVDCSYYTRYYALQYQPATMSFHVQDEMQVGNYPLCNVYATCKLYKVRFYLLWSHINQGWFGKNYFSMPHYPINPRCLQLGLSIDFAD